MSERAPEAAVDPALSAAPGGAVKGDPAGSSERVKPKRKKAKRKAAEATGGDEVEAAVNRKAKKKVKKNKLKSQESSKEGPGGPRNTKKPRKKTTQKAAPSTAPEGLTPAQRQAEEQMRRALEEDQYSAIGSIVDTDSDEEENYLYRGEAVRMDRNALMAAMRKHLWMERLQGSTGPVPAKAGEEEVENETHRGGRKKKKKGKRGKEDERSGAAAIQDTSRTPDAIAPSITAVDGTDEFDDRDGGSIFGQTTGSSNATWVECDKCKKWRRLRGVVDEKKLPSRWYCSMNKNDPERARCSAPEEEYETPHTPESAADARSRKHLRVWVRRLQCNEAYESRQPTLTRGRKRTTVSNCNSPLQWIRCCNPSCGKWRAILRVMDAKTDVIDRTADGEWYCVMNTWDEKTASCAAPQENLPALGCPSWVNQDSP